MPKFLFLFFLLANTLLSLTNATSQPQIIFQSLSAPSSNPPAQSPSIGQRPHTSEPSIGRKLGKHQHNQIRSSDTKSPTPSEAPQIAHKPTIPCCPPPIELTYSHVALILVPLNVGSPSILPSFQNIQVIQNPNIMNYQSQENKAEAENSAQNTNQYHSFSHSNTPVSFSSFQFVNRWIDSKI